MSELAVDAERRQLLEAALPHVAFDGWSWVSLRAAGEEIGLDAGRVENAFPGGPSEALELYIAEADRRMLQALEQHDLSAMKVHDRVALAIRLRLEQHARDREAIRRGLAVLALPQHTGLCLRTLYRTVDAIWAAAGDTATDYNFYTKRLLLAGVYMVTLLYWLEDTSEEHAATWAFLDHRLDRAMRLGRGIGGTMHALLDLPDRLIEWVPLRPGGRRPDAPFE